MEIDWEKLDKLSDKLEIKVEYFVEQIENFGLMEVPEKIEWLQKHFPEIQKRFMFANKYFLIGRLPEGFYKKGYAAIDLFTREKVALLLLKPETMLGGHIHSELPATNIFFNENRASYNLKHPNIIEFYDSNITEDNQLYIAFKLEDAITIEDSLRFIRENTDGDRYSESLVIKLMLYVSKALEYMHNKGYIHGDVKASNVLVNRENYAKLADFGTVRKIGDPTRILGSLSYTAPEVLRGEPPTPVSDVFSLGVLGYYMKYGELPFKVAEQDWPDGLVEKILTFEPEIHPNHKFLKVFLEKNPKKRLKNGAACRRVLNWLQSAPVDHRILFDLFRMPYRLLERFIYYNNFEFIGGRSYEKESG
ncbi:protein kinase [Candidatus Woesearchaeota archaeon]|nr:protein kinase [Candidatus Woesearchaeota archaeon]